MIALAHCDPDGQTICLIVDAATASTAIYANTAHADEREVHIREAERFGHNLPEGSYGQRNHQAIAARETRIATCLRAVERALTASPTNATRSARPSRPQPCPLQRRRPTWR